MQEKSEEGEPLLRSLESIGQQRTPAALLGNLQVAAERLEFQRAAAAAADRPARVLASAPAGRVHRERQFAVDVAAEAVEFDPSGGVCRELCADVPAEGLTLSSGPVRRGRRRARLRR